MKKPVVSPPADESTILEVPSYVISWFEAHKDRLESSLYYLIVSAHQDRRLNHPESMIGFVSDPRNKPIETLIRMKSEHYRVKKEEALEVEHFSVKLSSGDYLSDGTNPLVFKRKGIAQLLADIVTNDATVEKLEETRHDH